MKECLFIASLLFISFFTLVNAQEAVILDQWNFENIAERKSIEERGLVSDTIEGNYKIASGVKGSGLRLDGFTTRVVRKSEEYRMPGDSFTIGCWVALGSYPWNWCPVLTQETPNTKGYKLMIGPHGEVSLQVAVKGQWISCTSAERMVELRRWHYLAGVYKGKEYIAVYIDGKEAVSMPLYGSIDYAREAPVILGMVASAEKPSDIVSEFGTLPGWFSLDGIMDEITVYGVAQSSSTIWHYYASSKPGRPDIKPRVLPRGPEGPAQFGAFYTRLKYYDGWDELWAVDSDPDVVVRFKDTPVRVIFWRGTRYSPAWVSEKNQWMADQSVEAWNNEEGCFEHMQDKYCRFSHVRIIENTPARVIVHWRYAPVSSHYHLWRPDPRTGRVCWVDEYYYIYPDGSGIRKVSWKKGTLGYPRQFQESLPFLQPGQTPKDLLNVEYCHVADYEGRIGTLMYLKNPKEHPVDLDNHYTVQQYNFRSKYKPYILYEPGNSMEFARYMPGLSSYDKFRGCNHWPVGQASCDGRCSHNMGDRPSHILGFPISYPVIHENGNRLYWFALYGMNSMVMDELVRFGRSWAYAPEISVKGDDYISGGFDMSERCYQLASKNKKTKKLEFLLAGSEENPIYNPAFVIKNWNASSAKVLVNGNPIKTVRTGINHELEPGGDNLVVFLFLEKKESVNITIQPKEKIK